MKTTKAIILMMIAISAIALIAACSSDDEPEATTAPATSVPASATQKADDGAAEPVATVVKLGLLSPQTGPLAVYAAGFEDAAAVAIEQLNASQSEFIYELIVADSACDGTSAATAAQSLIDAGVAVIVGAACSGATLGAIAVAAPAGIPMVSYASTSPAVTGADDDGHLFRVVPSDAQQAVALAQVVAQSGVSNPAVIYMTNDYGAGLADNFESNTSQSICTQVGYDPTEGSYDAASLAQSVVDGGCDSVVLMSYATDGAAIMEALSAQGFTGALFGADGLADSNFQNSFSDVSALNGLIATRPRSGADSSAKSDFESAYAASGGDTEGIYTHEAYDAVNIAAAAVAAGGDILAAIARVGNAYDGASGVHTFDSNGDVLGTGYEVCEFRVSGGTTDFDCPQIWTQDSGLTGELAGPAAAEVVKLGLLSPQTGPLAVYAAGFENAAAVAIAQLNASQSAYVYELIVADSACDGTSAATAAQSLVDAGVSIIVGAACSGATLGAIAVAAPAGIPMVSYASTSPAVTGADDDGLLFRVVPSDAQQAVALAVVVDNAGVSSPAVLYMTNDYGAGLADNFASATPQSVCTQVGYDPTEGSYDAASLAQSVVDGGCDSVILMSYATDGAAIMEALAAQGFSGTLFGADGLADSNFKNSFSDVSALNGLIATRPRPGADSAAKSDFESAYAAAGGDTEGIYTHEAYDAVNIAAAAIALAAGGDLKAALAAVGTAYDGASGSHTFDSNGDVLGTGYEVCEFSVSGGTTDFDCPQIWTADSGLTGK